MEARRLRCSGHGRWMVWIRLSMSDADILTSAAPLGGVGSVALDVGVTTPFTAEALRSAELDVLEAYRTKKLRKYADAAEAAQWRYWPVLISAFGRAHAEAKKTV